MSWIRTYMRHGVMTAALGLAAYGTATAHGLPGTSVQRDQEAGVFDRFVASVGPRGGARAAPIGRAATPRSLFWTPPPHRVSHEVRLRPDWRIRIGHRIRSPFAGFLHRVVDGRHAGSQPRAAPRNPSDLESGFEALEDHPAGPTASGGAGAPSTTVTPEPFTLLLLGSGLVGVAGVGASRRRRGADTDAGFG